MLLSGKFLLRAGFLAVCVATATTVATIGPATGAPGDLTHTDVDFRSAGTTLFGTVVAPVGADRRGPGVVLVHGSGPGPRTQLWPEAEAFARAGIVTLVYDKRTAGYSKTERSYSLLARDALAAVRVLRGRPEVDPAKVGLWGLSEGGGWVGPLAASRSADVAFLITVGGSSVSPARQQAWSNRNHLSGAGVFDSLLTPLGVTGLRVLADAGVFPEAHYNPIPALERVRQPVLAVWGGDDRVCAPAEAVRSFPDALERGGNTHYTIRVFPGADHDLRTSPDYRRDEGAFAPGYVELVSTWIDGLADGPPSASTDSPPHQDRRSVPVTPLAWYEAIPAQLGTLALFGVAFLTYPLGAVTRRILGRRGPLPGRMPARLLAVTGPSTVLATIAFTGFVVLTAAQTVGPVLLGRPVVWLVLQLLAVVVGTATLATAVTWWRIRHQAAGWARHRLALLVLGGVVFLPWAGYWGLLTM